MTPFNAKPAAAILAERRLTATKGDRLDAAIRPKTLQEGFDIQRLAAEIWCAKKSDKVAGWKCLLASADKWVVAPIYGSTVFGDTGAAKLWPTGDVARIEPELVFEFGQALPVRSAAYSGEEIDQSIKRVCMAMELIHSRYTDSSQCEFPELLAEGLVNQGLLVGPEVDRTLASAANNIAIEMCCGDQPLQNYEGKHQNQDPVAPLYWLVNFLREQGIAILAGQYVITGSYAGVIEVPMDTQVTMRYQGLGELKTSFSTW